MHRLTMIAHWLSSFAPFHQLREDSKTADSGHELLGSQAKGRLHQTHRPNMLGWGARV